MIIARSPLRVTLGGGGTDLPSYYAKNEGFLIAGAIDKYVYITLHQTFEQKLILKYSSTEQVQEPSQVKHPIMREALLMLGIERPFLEITSLADIPAGTGLGSSGSFTTALLRALHAHRHNLVLPAELAEQACEIEIGRLGEPIGKQDQYIASFGGLTCFEFKRDGKIEAYPLNLQEGVREALEDGLLLFFTGATRAASEILRDQDTKTRAGDQSMMANLDFIKETAYRTHEMLIRGDLAGFAGQMHEHWMRKLQRSPAISTPAINEAYEHARANGAIGGKLMGAGGGGFLLLYTEDKARVRKAMKEKGLREVRFKFDFEGTKLVVTQG